MKVRELREWLAKFDDHLPVVFCSGNDEHLKVLELSDIAESDAFIRRSNDGVLYCKIGKTAISERHVFLNVESA